MESRIAPEADAGASMVVTPSVELVPSDQMAVSAPVPDVGVDTRVDFEILAQSLDRAAQGIETEGGGEIIAGLCSRSSFDRAARRAIRSASASHDGSRCPAPPRDRTGASDG